LRVFAKTHWKEQIPTTDLEQLTDRN